MPRPIVIVDYGMGNVRSLRNGLARAGADALLSADPASLAGAGGSSSRASGGFPSAWPPCGRAGSPIPSWRR